MMLAGIKARYFSASMISTIRRPSLALFSQSFPRPRWSLVAGTSPRRSESARPASSHARGDAYSDQGDPLPIVKCRRLASKLAEVSPGFTVRRVLPQSPCRSVGPFVFLDHFGPTASAMDVGPHPHVGLCTLTYLYSGAVLHRDSTGAEQPVLPNQVNFMCAGRGVTHSERPHEGDGSLHGLQLWVALPRDQEDADPAFYHSVTVEDMITLESNDYGVMPKLVLGEALGRRQENIPLVPGMEGIFFLSVEFSDEDDEGRGIVAWWECPPLGADRQVGIYAASGAATVTVGDGRGGVDREESLAAGQMLVLDDGSRPLFLESDVRGTKVAVLGGRPYPEPRRLLWNFCSSEGGRLERAMEGWRRLDHSMFPPVAGESNEDSIPPPSGFIGAER